MPPRGPALDALAELRPAVRAEALTAAVARAGSVLDGSLNVRREIVVVSGRASVDVLGLGKCRPALGRDARARAGRVARGREHGPVTGARVASAIVGARPARSASRATVERFGGQAGPVAASLVVGGTRVAEASVDVTPGRPSVVAFETTPRGRGWTPVEVRIEPTGETVAQDDVRFLALRVPPPPRVRVVRGDGARADRVTLALGVAAEAGALTLTEQAEGSLADLSGTDVLVLVGPTQTSPATTEALRAFSARGGGVIAFPGDRPEALNPILAALGGGRITGDVGASGGPSLGGLASTDLDHPVFAGVFDTSAPTVESPDVRRAVRYAPGRGDEQTLMQLAAGPPLLHEIRQGRGRTLLFGVAPDPAWTDLTDRALFLPLMLRSVLYVASSEAPGASEAARSVVVDGSPEGVRLIGPDGAVVPASVTPRGGRTLVALDAATQAGVYRVTRGDETLRLVAVNDAARESDTEALSPAEAARRLEAATGRPVRVVDGGIAGGGSSGVPVWTWLLALALACLVAETAVATRWRAEA